MEWNHLETKLANELPFQLIKQSSPLANEHCFTKFKENSLPSFIYR